MGVKLSLILHGLVGMGALRRTESLAFFGGVWMASTVNTCKYSDLLPPEICVNMDVKHFFRKAHSQLCPCHVVLQGHQMPVLGKIAVGCHLSPC
jgi:hypothetical protein